MSIFNFGNTEAAAEMPDAMRGPSINSHLAASAVSSILMGEDRGAAITTIEDYKSAHVLGDFDDAEGYYLDGSQ